MFGYLRTDNICGTNNSSWVKEICPQTFVLIAETCGAHILCHQIVLLLASIFSFPCHSSYKTKQKTTVSRREGCWWFLIGYGKGNDPLGKRSFVNCQNTEAPSGHGCSQGDVYTGMPRRQAHQPSLFICFCRAQEVPTLVGRPSGKCVSQEGEAD